MRNPQRKILDILDQLAGLDSVENRVALSDFTHTFQHWLERSSVTDDRRNRDGVMVLNATAARGLSFRALFVLGMNEGVFPRTIREDAFLRDRDREVLERDLGYKVSQKLTAFDEEKLLFTLLVGAARERLYCSFQRADDSGRVLAPSWYIDELKRALDDNGRQSETISIPRSITEKTATPPFDRQIYCLPAELAIRLTLEAQDPTALVEACAVAAGALQTRPQGRRRNRSKQRPLAWLRRHARPDSTATGNISPSAAFRRPRSKPMPAARFSFSRAMCLAWNRSTALKRSSDRAPPSSARSAMRF